MQLEPEVLIRAYCHGAFPMADHDGHIRWYTADPRGVLPLEKMHVPRSLRQVMKRKPFEIRVNSDFEQTMRGCMENRDEGTWINGDIISAYLRLHSMGLAHSVECWREGKLVGGLYGVSLGGAFFGESMFHREDNASKVALVSLVERLRDRGYALLDTQTTTAHLKWLGVVEVPAAQYMDLLQAALSRECRFA